jgi:hypothetical protein
MKRDTNLSLREVSDYFEDRGAVLNTLRNLARALSAAGIQYAVIGALALREHSFVRATVDIDLLTTPEGLQALHDRIIGLGFRPAFPGARKKLRATDSGVKVDVIMTGEYPGDGKPKDIRFPDPAAVSFESNGVRYLNLETLVELKLASGISAPHRARDLADIQDLIRETRLPLELAEKLHESVRECYRDLWQKAQIRDPFDE